MRAVANINRRFGGRGKAVRQLLTEFPEWLAEQTGRAHWRLTSPTGAIVFCPGTPGLQRTIHNVRAKMRRAERGAQ